MDYGLNTLSTENTKLVNKSESSSTETKLPFQWHLKEITGTLIMFIGSLSFGCTLSYSSPAIPQLLEKGILDEAGTSWFGSLVTLGAVLGAFGSGIMADTLGRKGTVMLGNVPFLFGWVILIIFETPAAIFSGRIITGIGMGIYSSISPVYIGEIASKQLRGSLGSISQLFISMGILLTYTLRMVATWKQIALTGACIAPLQTIYLCFIPETPRWYIKRGNKALALRSLRWLRGKSADIFSEYHEIQENVANHPQTPTWSSFIRQSQYYKPLMAVVTSHIFQKLIGINVIQFYTESIFESAGFTENGDIPSIMIGVVGFLGSIPSLYLMDRLGRKRILIFSSLCLAMSCFTLALFYFLVQTQGITGINWLPVISLAIYIFFFNIAWGPIPWIFFPEMLPLQIRGQGIAISSVVNWMGGVLITKGFPVLIQATSSYVGYWIFSGTCILSAPFVIVFVPETKGKSLEDLERVWTKTTSTD